MLLAYLNQDLVVNLTREGQRLKGNKGVQTYSEVQKSFQSFFKILDFLSSVPLILNSAL